MRSQGVDDRRGSKRHADGGCLQKAERQAGAGEREMRDEREQEEAEGAAGRAAPGHLELSDSGEGASHVAALQGCGDDADATDQLAVLCVAPIEH